MKNILIIFVFALFVGCTNESGALDVLDSEGCIDTQITGYRFFGCSKDDMFHTGFTCKKNGRTVSGVVCQGVLKGKTIRYD